nr:mucin-12-like [Zootoca vivipara]
MMGFFMISQTTGPPGGKQAPSGSSSKARRTSSCFNLGLATTAQRQTWQTVLSIIPLLFASTAAYNESYLAATYQTPPGTRPGSSDSLPFQNFTDGQQLTRQDLENVSDSGRPRFPATGRDLYTANLSASAAGTVDWSFVANTQWDSSNVSGNIELNFSEQGPLSIDSTVMKMDQNSSNVLELATSLMPDSASISLKLASKGVEQLEMTTAPLSFISQGVENKKMEAAYTIRVTPTLSPVLPLPDTSSSLQLDQNTTHQSAPAFRNTAATDQPTAADTVVLTSRNPLALEHIPMVAQGLQETSSSSTEMVYKTSIHRIMAEPVPMTTESPFVSSLSAATDGAHVNPENYTEDPLNSVFPYWEGKGTIPPTLQSTAALTSSSSQPTMTESSTNRSLWSKPRNPTLPISHSLTAESSADMAHGSVNKLTLETTTHIPHSSADGEAAFSLSLAAVSLSLGTHAETGLPVGSQSSWMKEQVTSLPSSLGTTEEDSFATLGVISTSAGEEARLELKEDPSPVPQELMGFNEVSTHGTISNSISSSPWQASSSSSLGTSHAGDAETGYNVGPLEGVTNTASYREQKTKPHKRTAAAQLMPMFSSEVPLVASGESTSTQAVPVSSVTTDLLTSPRILPDAMKNGASAVLGTKETSHEHIRSTTTQMVSGNQDGNTPNQPVSKFKAPALSQFTRNESLTWRTSTPPVLAVHNLPLRFRLIGIDYEESLENKSSQSYKKLEKEVKLTLNKMLSTYETFLQANILHFLNGSVIAEAVAVFQAGGPVPTPSDIIRTIVTEVERREMDTFFGWRVDVKSLQSKGFSLKNLEPEKLDVSFTVLGLGSSTSFDGIMNLEQMEKLRRKVVLLLGTQYTVQNISLNQVRYSQGGVDINGEVYIDTIAHVDVGWALKELMGLRNYSVDLTSLSINGSRLSLQVFPVSFLVTNRIFNERMMDRSSVEHQNLARDISDVLTHILGKYKNLLQVAIRDITGGSLICHGDVIFQHPAPTSKDVLQTLTLSVGPKDYLDSSDLKVDPFSFTVAGDRLEPPVTHRDVSGYVVAILVLCVLALFVLPILALLRKVLGRRDKIIINRGRDHETGVEIFELDNPGFHRTPEETLKL